MEKAAGRFQSRNVVNAGSLEGDGRNMYCLQSSSGGGGYVICNVFGGVPRTELSLHVCTILLGVVLDRTQGKTRHIRVSRGLSGRCRGGPTCLF